MVLSAIAAAKHADIGHEQLDTTIQPMKAYQQLCHVLHRLTLYGCVGLLALLLCSETLIVILRYCFGIGFLELQDFAAYVFASLFMLGLPAALVMNRHVRVDVIRERQSLKSRRRVDHAATVVLLVPVFVLCLYWVYPDIAYAWKIREGSRETGGLGGVYLIKSVLPLTCVLMIMQAVASLADDGEDDCIDNVEHHERR